MINLYIGVVNEKYPDKKKTLTVGQIAIINEYGTDKIPPRPAFTMGLEMAMKKHKKLIDASLHNVVNHMLTGRTTSIERQFTQAFTQIGKTAKKETKNIIKQGSTIPNAPLTIKRKGFDHPLWETGLLYECVEYKVGK